MSEPTDTPPAASQGQESVDETVPSVGVESQAPSDAATMPTGPANATADASQTNGNAPNHDDIPLELRNEIEKALNDFMDEEHRKREEIVKSVMEEEEKAWEEWEVEFKKKMTEEVELVEKAQKEAFEGLVGRMKEQEESFKKYAEEQAEEFKKMEKNQEVLVQRLKEKHEENEILKKALMDVQDQFKELETIVDQLEQLKLRGNPPMKSEAPAPVEVSQDQSKEETTTTTPPAVVEAAPEPTPTEPAEANLLDL